MAKPKVMYKCEACEHKTPIQYGICPNCGGIQTLKEETVESGVTKNARSIKSNFSSAKKFNEIISSEEYRIKTNMLEFDRVYGDGIVSDSVNTLAAVAGAGKTTLLLEAAHSLAMQGHPVLYASAEESEVQLKRKCERLFGATTSQNLHLLATRFIENALEEAGKIKAKMIIIDSNKAFSTLDEVASGSRPGSPTQMLVCTDKVIDYCKNPKHPTIGFIISQFTKDEKMAGPEEFKHAVDSCAYLDYDEGEEIRILRTEKNRFNELENGIFIMGEKGLISVDNPSEYFTTERADNDLVPGVAKTVIKEGSRAIVAEVEALATRSYTSYPTRIASCLKRDNLNILISIITECMGISMFDYDIIINTTGGLKLSTKSSDLAIIMSILSQTTKGKKAIPNDSVFLAEVGLTGELKKVQGIERRIKELDRMGYKKVYVAKNNVDNKKQFSSIEVIECKNINEVWSKI